MLVEPPKTHLFRPHAAQELRQVEEQLGKKIRKYEDRANSSLGTLQGPTMVKLGAKSKLEESETIQLFGCALNALHPPYPHLRDMWTHSDGGKVVWENGLMPGGFKHFLVTFRCLVCIPGISWNDDLQLTLLMAYGEATGSAATWLFCCSGPPPWLL